MNGIFRPPWFRTPSTCPSRWKLRRIRKGSPPSVQISSLRRCQNQVMCPGRHKPSPRLVGACASPPARDLQINRKIIRPFLQGDFNSYIVIVKPRSAADAPVTTMTILGRCNTRLTGLSPQTQFLVRLFHHIVEKLVHRNVATRPFSIPRSTKSSSRAVFINHPHCMVPPAETFISAYERSPSAPGNRFPVFPLRTGYTKVVPSPRICGFFLAEKKKTFSRRISFQPVEGHRNRTGIRLQSRALPPLCPVHLGRAAGIEPTGGLEPLFCH